MKTTKNPHTGKTNCSITDLTKSIENNDLHVGRMLSWSKSSYRKSHPDGKAIFNACIYNTDAIQVWWGDLDMVIDVEKLQNISNESNQEFYVTTESYRSDFKKVTKKDLEKGLEPEYGFIARVTKFKPSDK
jgi:hypothetical protein